ncbi:MAG: lytic murein transglycosylase [Pseudorhodoplanes sp.]|nr:lytic murein transglycosylase [Pseudorhodoplanes sp.]
MRQILLRSLALLAFLVSAPIASASAVPCGGDFGEWLAAFQREAAAKGVSQRALAALTEVSPDPKVVSLDRRQGVFKQSFEEFAGPRIAQRLSKATRMLEQYGSVLDRIEQQYGVQGEVVVAIWGLETDFGAVMGKHPALRALATLAHDCRRSEMFQAELMDALRIIDRGDLAPGEMRGAWAGELGQTQFLPSSYVKFAVDFDGNGRRDLIRSVPDVLASTANYLRGYGWRRGERFGEGSHNYEVLKQWNKSQVYQKTIAAFAARLANPQ